MVRYLLASFITILTLSLPFEVGSSGDAIYTTLLGEDGQIIVTGRLTSTMGSTGRMSSDQLLIHNGIDVAAPLGTPVYAPADGDILLTQSKGYGNMLVLESDGFKAVFAHLNNFEVANGQVVRRGDLIARIGCSGDAPRPHVHIETFVHGERISPLQAWGVIHKSWGNL